MKVGSTPDLMIAYIDFGTGGDEKRRDVTSTIAEKFPMCIIFGGDGSYKAPYHLHSDTLLSDIIGQVERSYERLANARSGIDKVLGVLGWSIHCSWPNLVENEPLLKC